MRRREILQHWMRRYGWLSAPSQERFLRRKATVRLARYPDHIVRQAIGWSNLLDDALSFAHSAYEGEGRSLPPEPHTPPRPGRTTQVAEAQPRRDMNLERRLAHRIGPVQNYEDDF
jgi:hypothetical protein